MGLFGSDSDLPGWFESQYSLTSTTNRFLPFALRRFNTMRPPFVDMRVKRPWVLFRFVLLG